jgi:hypothetical protein
LWIAVPRAVTISQKLEMKGERVTVSNIEKTVKEEYEGVKANFKKFEKTEGYSQASSAVEEIFQVLGRILTVLLEGCGRADRCGARFRGFIILMTFLGMFVFGSPFIPGWFNGDIFPVNEFLSAFIDPTSLTIMLVALLFAVLIPLIAIIYGGIKLVFQLRTRDGGLGLVALVIWIVAVSVLFSMAFVEGRKFAFKETSRENVIITTPPGSTLYLQLNERVSPASIEEIAWFDKPSRGMYFEQRREIYYARPALSIRHAQVEAPELVIERKARGSSRLQAERNADRISYSWAQEDSILIFDNLLALEPGAQWRFEEITLHLNLPENQRIHVGDRMERIITSARTVERRSISSLTGKKWRMTREGLEPALSN